MSQITRGQNLRYLSRKDVENLGISRRTVLDHVRRALVEHGHKRTEMPAKIGVHPYEDVFFHAMPAFIPEMDVVGAKWIECYPRNPREFGLPQTTGVLCLNDVETGVPLSIMDCTWLTAARTPAVTVLMAKELHPGARSFGMFGAGVQGREHVRYAAEHLDSLEEIVVFDRFPEVAERLVADLQPETGVKLRVGASIEQVVKECEVLSSATLVVREPLALAKSEWVSAGQTILPCDLNTFWDPEIPMRADAYITDSTEEHDLFVEMGYYPGGSPRIAAESGEVLAGLKPGRTSPDQLIVNSNIGMAVCDMAVAAAIHEAAEAAGAGQLLEL
ncbi:ornithine cyclodeaminase family protein [Leucobacter ruminantium]|uniref:Ornithine cyclodeaminase family protein n=1 Tax=Leucobacter ruminantium TaxID=1289170 RepID=A0A939RTF3_9MICO|nr:ornithine cyclodeaminase family protein [Leucobacter ruminantium]MBO1804185.1 ornithine cyclodeaminase family protein [Leucobacter ruminantium]